MILPHDANPGRIEFSETTPVRQHHVVQLNRHADFIFVSGDECD
jgi:hypothetical protein